MVDPFAIRRSAAADVVVQQLNRKFRVWYMGRRFGIDEVVR